MADDDAVAAWGPPVDDVDLNDPRIDWTGGAGAYVWTKDVEALIDTRP
jgi:hypothetical protein